VAHRQCLHVCQTSYPSCTYSPLLAVRATHSAAWCSLGSRVSWAWSCVPMQPSKHSSSTSELTVAQHILQTSPPLTFTFPPRHHHHPMPLPCAKPQPPAGSSAAGTGWLPLRGGFEGDQWSQIMHDGGHSIHQTSKDQGVRPDQSLCTPGACSSSLSRLFFVRSQKEVFICFFPFCQSFSVEAP